MRWVAARKRLRLRSLANFGLLPPLQLEPAACTRHSQRGIAKVRGIQGTRAGNRGCTADGRFREPSRRPATMPTESISAFTITLATSDGDAARPQLLRHQQGAIGLPERAQPRPQRPRVQVSEGSRGHEGRGEEESGVERRGRQWRRRERGMGRLTRRWPRNEYTFKP